MARQLFFFVALATTVTMGLGTPPARANNNARIAQIKQLFAEVNEAPKGALGPNVYQRPKGRLAVLQDGVIVGPPGDTLITVAFRSDTAQQLAALGFYVGNRFGSNYWELNNKHLATPQEKRAHAFRFDHAKFMETPAIHAEAQAMTRYSIVESFYMQKFPQTSLAQGSMQRGTADADHEKKYYGLLNQYLAKYLATDADYLLLFEVQRRFNLTGDAGGISLQKLRDTVAAIYDRIEQQHGGSALAQSFRNIRNSIHNYMTPEVLSKLNSFINNYGRSVSGSDLADIRRLRDSVAAYYRTDKKIVAGGAKAIEALLPQGTLDVIEALADKGNAPEKLETLSWMLTQARQSFMASRDPEIIHWMIKANRFLQAELAAQKPNEANWAVRARVALDSAYASGLVSAAQWAQVRTDLANVGSNNAAALKNAHAQLVAVISASPGLLRRALTGAIEDWAKVERSTETVIDDSLRGSLMTELNNLATYVKGKIPNQVKTKYTIENEGETYGYLIYLPVGTKSEDVAKLDKFQIPVFAELPLDLSVVAGIITEQPQTPLSHVNIKSKARGTPNVYYPGAATDPLLKDLIKKKALVRLVLKAGKMTIKEAKLEEAKAFWAKMKAPTKVEVRSDLNETRIRTTRELRAGDVITVGAKAANYAEASQAVGESVIRDALGLPFFYYKQFVDTNYYEGQQTLSQRIEQLVNDPRIKTDRAFLVAQLKQLQARMTAEDMLVNPELVKEIEAKTKGLYPGRTWKFRSSTNSEDLPNFSGAGLYDSYSYDPAKPKKNVATTLKKTWASVWNLRAFDEREHFGIDHLQVYMGMLISPGYPDELANGVAVTRNINQPQLGPGFYINTQLGEEAVTNPNPQLTP